MADKDDLTIQFANLLHDHGPTAPVVIAFLKKHEKDDVLRRRMAVLIQLHRMSRGDSRG